MNKKVDPVIVEVIRNLLLSIADETNTVIIKSAYSTNIKERRDNTVAIMDGDGNVVSANVPHQNRYGSFDEHAEQWDGWTTLVWTVVESHDPDNPGDKTLDYSMHGFPGAVAYNVAGRPFVVDSS